MKDEIKKGFTIVELVIVIAIIALLSSVLIPTFTGIINSANQSKAIQEAKNAWNEVSYTYISGYKGFTLDGGCMNGWYYDYVENIAKYDVDNEYTVTYDGNQFIVKEFDNNFYWPSIDDCSSKFTSFSNDPYGLIITYYDGINSRGFSWMTNKSNNDSELYIVEGNQGMNSQFGLNPITGTYFELVNCNSHKVHIENLKYGSVYSYKVGGNGYYKYGVFRVENSNPSSITAIQLSDAQTKYPEMLYKWENTFAQSIETAGHGLDMILYNGDQANTGNYQPGSNGGYDLRYCLARDTISSYTNSIPYMSSMGNHEGNSTSNKNIHYSSNDIKFPYDNVVSNNKEKGCYYSFDYYFAHFVILNTNDNNDEQINWLKKDLSSCNASWIIVMMHNGPFSTGDNSNSTASQNIVTKYSGIFSQYHVDLVLQAHDHVFTKTLPYKWNTDGYTETYNNKSIINFNVSKLTIDNIKYDVNPNGTYYVTTGAAGHRVGESEADAGIWADLDLDGKPLIENISFKNNKYKVELDTINISNKYNPFSANNISISGSNYSYTNSEKYVANVSKASGNINSQMFGILELTNNSLQYKFYTVNKNDVRLFDTLNVIKK